MPEPEDFGLSPVRTLAMVADPRKGRDHNVYWGVWWQHVTATRPELCERERVDPSDPGITHEFESLKGVHIGCRLIEPETPARAILVVVHGEACPPPVAEEARRWSAMKAKGVAVLIIRLRGFPGSQTEVGDWLTPGPDAIGGWATLGFDVQSNHHHDLLDWSIPQVIADVVNACRAARNWLRTRHSAPVLDVFLHGDSLGGGLAAIAAAELAGRLPHDPIVTRLAMAFPSMGAWSWRLENARSCGVCQQFCDVIRQHAAREEELVRRLMLHDAAIHATHVRCPALCMLAERDDVVPAPSAAAVYNALNSAPGRKWRYIVPFGHYDGGIGPTRRIASFSRLEVEFFDPSRPVEDVMASADAIAASETTTGEQLGLLDVGGEHKPTPAEEQLIADAYEQTGRTLDDLPYTEEFDRLFAQVGHLAGNSRGELLRRLQRMRKAGKLPRLGGGRTGAVRVADEDEALVESLVVEAVGGVGKRDRLPYTEEFDRLLERFNERTGRGVGPHDLWRLIARIAK